MDARNSASGDGHRASCALCHHAASLDALRRLQGKHPDRRTVSATHAATHGRLAHVRHWIEHMHYDVDTIDARGMTLLHHAAVNGHASAVALLLQHGAALQMRVADSKDTALHLAAAHGRVAVVQCLLAAGAHIEARTIEGETPLLAAVRTGHVRVVQTLLAHGASPTAPWPSQDLDIGTGLHLAAQCGHARLVTFLLGVVGLDVNQRTQRRRATPLHVAARHGHVALVQLLVLRHRADVHARDAQAMTPLHYVCDAAERNDAVEHHRVAIARLLLAVGAKINARRQRDHATPLRCAARRGRWLVAKLLLDHDACSNTATRWLFALRWAARDLHTLKYLVRPSGKRLSAVPSPKMSCDADRGDCASSSRTQPERPVDTTRARRASLLGLCVPRHSSSTLEPLGSKTASAPIEGGATALHAACFAEDTAALQTLECRISPHGSTPLHTAAQRGWLSGVSLLLDAGADANATTGTRGATPLHLAAARGHMGVIERLLAHGADPRARDGDGATPLVVALLSGRSLALKVLVQHSGDAIASSNEALAAALSLQALARVRSAQRASVASVSSKSSAAPSLTHNASGTTALHLAAFSGDLALIQDLVYSGGTDIDARDCDGKTPVWLAALMGHLAVVTFLFEHGADASVGASVAAECGHLEVLAFVSTRSPPELELCAAGDRGSLTRLSLDDHARATQRSLTHSASCDQQQMQSRAEV